MKKTFLLFALLTFLLGACQSPASPALAVTPDEPETMTFMAGYKPQANLPFVGVYVAQENGYFAEEGLNVIIEHSPGQGQHLQLVASGKVQVTTQDAAILLRRRSDPGLPLVSFALIGQKGQQAFAALQSVGLSDPKDWQGKKVGYKGAPPPELFALIAAAGADVNQIELINVGFDPRLLVENKVDVYPVYKSNEPFQLEKWGYPLTLWTPEQYDVPSLGLTYVTSEDTLAQNPQMLAKFLRAVLKGIDYAAAHPDEATEMVLKYAGPETDPELMRFMLDTELADSQSDLTEENGIGWQTLDQWQSLAEMLSTYEDLPELDPAAAFTTQVLQAARQP